ncbi:sigma-70 family RNA polymerase sigma factor [Amycolatopsis sp.]|jgi:RNA polymerase sigma-70 factor (ECF subfamily)|uniref:RNA polymerase sigma factor n=1 Tax=Amycolatopsis sp. TaxID=37632 RepID=UPI002DFB8F5E|nr:sigma-70 family RNA polymerase sigma factor [Amycolatopsis sp.]
MTIAIEACPRAAFVPAQRATDGMSTEDVWCLVDRARQGDQFAFSMLYEQHFDSVFGYVLVRTKDRSLTEEITSETFLKAFRRLDSLSYHGTSFRAWVMTIARNLVIDDAKSARRRYEVFLPEGFDAPSDTADPAAQLCARAEAAAIRDCMQWLTPDQRECLHLRFFEHLPVEEVARIMRRRDVAVRVLQMRAVRRLRDLYCADSGGSKRLARQ